MTITLEIPPKIESVLSAKAKLFGSALPDYLYPLLETNTDDYSSLSVGEISSVQAGLAEIEAGDKGILLEEFKEEMAERRAQRSQQRVEVAA